MIKIRFSQEENDRLYDAQLNHPVPKVRRKILALYLKSQGISHDLICKTCRISWPTMTSYFNEYMNGDFEQFAQTRHHGNPSKLKTHGEVIKDAFAAKPPATLKEARARIAALTGLERSIPQIWAFLRTLGLRTRKVGGVPGRVDPAAQEDFKKRTRAKTSGSR